MSFSAIRQRFVHIDRVTVTRTERSETIEIEGVNDRGGAVVFTASMQLLAERDCDENGDCAICEGCGHRACRCVCA